MVLGKLRTALRGCVAWIAGAIATVLLSLAGAVDGGIRAFIAAHAVPFGGGDAPVWLVLVPVAAVGLAGYRTGRSTAGGLFGRLREVAASVTDGGRSASKRAGIAGAVAAAGYAVTGAVAAALVGGAAGSTLVSGGVLGLAVAVPAAVLAARR